MTENCQNRNLKALEAFFIQLGSFFDRNCWETPQAFFQPFLLLYNQSDIP